MICTSRQFRAVGPVPLHSGETLSNVDLVYETYGELNAAGDNAILLFHTLTGSQHAAGFNDSNEALGDRWTEECHWGWWDRFIGPGRALDTDRSHIICANYLGGCYGSTGPATVPPGAPCPLGARFPRITLGDIVSVQTQLLDHLGVERLQAVVGPSVGGLMCLIFATRYPDRVEGVIPIAAGLSVTPLQRLINFEQILAIQGDTNFCSGDYYAGTPPEQGLALARIISHKTFVSVSDLEQRARSDLFRTDSGAYAGYQPTHNLESYMLHHGRRFAARFDANSYLRIVEAWQAFDLAKEADSKDVASALSKCSGQRLLTFSIDSDVCFYPEEQEHMVQMLGQVGVKATRFTVHSDKGHDSFLLEPELYAPQIRHFLYD